VGFFKSKAVQARTVREDEYIGLVNNITAPTIAVGRVLDAQRAEFERMGLVPLGSAQSKSSASESESRWRPSSSTGRDDEIVHDSYLGPVTKSELRKVRNASAGPRLSGGLGAALNDRGRLNEIRRG
jgi:hypothetical protein